MKDWYRFDTLVEAKSALDKLNNSLSFPVVGINARTKKLEHTKQKTERWANGVTNCEDRKYGFPSPPDFMFTKLQIPKEPITEADGKTIITDGFLDTHKPTVETFDPRWFKEVEP